MVSSSPVNEAKVVQTTTVTTRILPDNALETETTIRIKYPHLYEVQIQRQERQKALYELEGKTWWSGPDRESFDAFRAHGEWRDATSDPFHAFREWRDKQGKMGVLPEDGVARAKPDVDLMSVDGSSYVGRFDKMSVDGSSYAGCNVPVGLTMETLMEHNGRGDDVQKDKMNVRWTEQKVEIWASQLPKLSDRAVADEKDEMVLDNMI